MRRRAVENLRGRLQIYLFHNNNRDFHRFLSDRFIRSHEYTCVFVEVKHPPPGVPPLLHIYRRCHHSSKGSLSSDWRVESTFVRNTRTRSYNSVRTSELYRE